jgi:two-component system response regulator FixJ
MRSEKPAGSYVVCVVDDDPLVLNSLRHLLASDGIAARSFDKAETFLAHIEIHRVALVVLDIWMAGMTGLEVQARLSSMCCQTRIIIMADSEVPDDERTAMQAGAMAFLKKPFDDDHFLAAVHDALAQAKASQELPPEAIVGRPKVP